MNTDVALLALFVTVSCVIVSNMTSKVEWKRGFLTEQSTGLALARHFRITIRQHHPQPQSRNKGTLGQS